MVHCFNCYNKLELLVCFAGNCEQNFLGGGKSASFPFVRSFRQSNRNSKGSEIKGGGVNNFGIIFRGHKGGRGGAFWNFQRQGRLKCSCCPW